MSQWSSEEHSLNLTYCLNVHPSFTLDQIKSSIERYTLPLKERVAPDQKLGLGLRFSLPTVDDLRKNEKKFNEFVSFLHENDLYVFTLNAFPAGEFQNSSVKEDVYRPTWLEEDRVRFTKWAGEILSRLLPEDIQTGTVSTLPGTFREWGNSEATWEHVMGNMLRVVYQYKKLEEETGKRIVMCIEPEPFCTFERTRDIVTFFEEYLFQKGVEQYREAFGFSAEESRNMIRRHTGVCIDTSHLAVCYDDITEAIDRFRDLDITVGKVQISCAPVLLSPDAKPEGRRTFLDMDETQFLHQTFGRDGNGQLHSVKDLSALKGDRLEEWKTFSEWRTHFHVPVFLEKFGDIHTTQEVLVQAVDYSFKNNLCSHFEIETYSWNVLPISTRKSLNITNLVDVLENEFNWVEDRLRTSQYESV